MAERIVGKYEERGVDECWPWTAAKTSAGYGHLLADGEGMEKRKTVLAHRALYEMVIGPIAESLVLDHGCHTADQSCVSWDDCPHRGCVNPYHMEPVTFAENLLRGRGIGAVNASKAECNSGHPYSEDSYTNIHGARVCRICARARHARWLLRNPDYVRPSRREAA